MEFKETAKAHTDTDGDSKCDDCGVKMAVADPSTPPTADGFYILLWIMMMAACLFAMAVVIRRWKKLTA